MPGSSATSRSSEGGRIFLLSPARCGGPRTTMLLSERASFALAERVRRDGAPLGEVFAFLSGLYFRGKLAYAQRFAAPPDPTSPLAAGGVLVITAGAGLRGADTAITAEALRLFAQVDVHADNRAFRQPLEESARAVRDEVGEECEVVLLGSIASEKYVEALTAVFGDHLLFPREFVGRGDMSRGGLLLRHVRAGEELDYIPVRGAVRHGPRPPKLPPLPRSTQGA